MKQTFLGGFLAVLALAGLALPASGSVWYASAANYGKSGLDGLSEATAYGTIQAAVDAASEGDTVIVLPGVYDKGSRDGLKHTDLLSQPTRVVVDKRLTIKSRDGKASTHVVGVVKTDDAGNPNLQTDSVSGFYIRAAAAGTVIEGVTIRNCAMYSNNGADDNGGAAICSEATGFTNSFYVCYSAISNCCAYRAGATRSGVAIGVYYFRNWGYYGTTGKADCNAAYQTSCYNCIFAENGINDLSSYAVPSSYAVREPGLMVNCTFVDNHGRTGVYAENSSPTAGVNGHLYNCVSYENYTHPTCAKLVLHNVFTDCDTGFSAESERLNLFSYDSTATKLKLCLCPLLGDYRPVSGGSLDKAGDRTYLAQAFIPEAYRYRDFDGNAFDSSANIPIGAILSAAAAGSGYITTGSSFLMRAEVDGHPITSSHAILRSATYPAQVKIAACYRQLQPCMVGVAHSSIIQYFGKYGYCWQTLPPLKDQSGNATTGLAITPSLHGSSQVFYVDCSLGNDGNPGTEEQPFKTIQGAVDWCAAKFYNGSISLIWVKPGTYNAGGTADSHFGNARARIVIPERTHVFIRSTSGAAKTFIEGEPDPSSANGVGASAMRCFSSWNNSNVCICDFTLRKGYGSLADGEYARGACGRAGGVNQQMVDCIVTDCHGDTPGVNQVWCRRCLFTGNEVTTGNGISGEGNGIVINSTASACVFANNSCASSCAYLPFGPSSYAYHCTVYEPSAPSETLVYHYNRKLVNTAVMAGGRTPEASGGGRIVGSVIDTCRYEVTLAGCLHLSPVLYDAANGDYRPVVGSPVFGAGAYADAKAIVKTTDYYMYDNGDYYNNSTVSADGSVFAGAIGESTTTHDVYVNAVKGSDSNDGLSAAKPKKTLLAAMAIAKGGSTVYAAPGVYSDGTMSYVGHVVNATENPQNVKNRVVVPSSVTLKATGARTETHIVGSYGSGTAVRPVFLNSNAKVSGFTLRGGRVSDIGGTGDDTYGAGVFGRGPSMNSIAENCVITDNLGVRGAAGAYMTFQGCIVTNNALTADTSGHEDSAGIRASAYSTYFADCRGNRALAYMSDVVNCVFGPGLTNLSGAAMTTIAEVRSDCKARFLNCIYYAPFSGTMDLSQAEVRNCYFAKEVTVKFGTSSGVNQDYTREELAALFDEVGRPATDEALGITEDKGYASAKEVAGSVDADGNQRVWNRDIDLGAYEVDRSEDVKKKIQSPQVTLNEVSSGIKIVSTGLDMQTGDRLSFVWPTGTLSGAYRVNYSLGTGGRLRITVNGTVYEVSSGDSVGFMSDLSSQTISIECLAGTAVIAKCGRSSGVYLHFR